MSTTGRASVSIRVVVAIAAGVVAIALVTVPMWLSGPSIWNRVAGVPAAAVGVAMLVGLAVPRRREIALRIGQTRTAVARALWTLWIGVIAVSLLYTGVELMWHGGIAVYGGPGWLSGTGFALYLFWLAASYGEPRVIAWFAHH